LKVQYVCNAKVYPLLKQSNNLNQTAGVINVVQACRWV